MAATVRSLGHTAVLIDAGIMGEPAAEAAVLSRELARAAGADLDTLRAEGDRGAASRGHGAGGSRPSSSGCGKTAASTDCSASAALAARPSPRAAMQALPIGFPKVLVSTMGSGNTRALCRHARRDTDAFRRRHQRPQPHLAPDSRQRGRRGVRHGLGFAVRRRRTGPWWP